MGFFDESDVATLPASKASGFFDAADTLDHHEPTIEERAADPTFSHTEHAFPAVKLDGSIDLNDPTFQLAYKVKEHRDKHGDPTAPSLGAKAKAAGMGAVEFFSGAPMAIKGAINSGIYHVASALDIPGAKEQADKADVRGMVSAQNAEHGAREMLGVIPAVANRLAEPIVTAIAPHVMDATAQDIHDYYGQTAFAKEVAAAKTAAGLAQGQVQDTGYMTGVMKAVTGAKPSEQFLSPAELAKEGAPLTELDKFGMRAAGATANPANVAFSFAPEVPGVAAGLRGAGTAAETVGAKGLQLLAHSRAARLVTGTVGVGGAVAAAEMLGHGHGKALGEGLLASGGLGLTLAGLKYGGRSVKYAGMIGEQALPETVGPVGATVAQTIRGAAGGAALMGGQEALTGGDVTQGVLSGMAIGGLGSIAHPTRGIRQQASAKGLEERGASLRTGTPYDEVHDAVISRFSPQDQAAINRLRGHLDTGNPVNLVVVDGPTFAQANAAENATGAERGSFNLSDPYSVSTDGRTIFLNADSFTNQAGGTLDTAGHEVGHAVVDYLSRAGQSADAARMFAAIKSGLTGSELQTIQDRYAKSRGQATSESGAIEENLAEITRKILQGEDISNFALPKPLAEKIKDAASRFFEDQGWLPKTEGLEGMGFGTKNVAEAARQMRDALYQQGAEARAKRLDAQAGKELPQRAQLQEIYGQIAKAEAKPFGARTQTEQTALDRLIVKREELETGLRAVSSNPAIQTPPVTPVATPTAATTPPLATSAPAAPAVAPQGGNRADVALALRTLGYDQKTAAEMAAAAEGATTGEMIANATQKKSGAVLKAKGNLSQVGATAAPADLSQISSPNNLLGEKKPGDLSTLATPNEPKEVSPVSQVAPQATDLSTMAAVLPKENAPISAPNREGSTVDANALTQAADNAEQAVRDSRTARHKESTLQPAIDKARIEAMAQEHAKQVGVNSDLVTWRKNKVGKEGIYGRRIDPSDPLHAELLNRAGMNSPEGIKKLMDLQSKFGQSIGLEYLSAPEETGGKAQFMPEDSHQIAELRRRAQEEHSASNRTGGLAPVRRVAKSFIPTGFTFNGPSGTIEVNGFSPDKVLSNAAKVLPWLKSKGIEPYTGGVNDPLLIRDLNTYSENHKRGWLGNGSRTVKGTDLTLNEKPADTPAGTIPKDRFDALNAIMGDTSAASTNEQGKPKRTTIERTEKGVLAEMNSPFFDPQSGETNKVRDLMAREGDFKFTNAKGEEFTGKHVLENANETLRPELIENIGEPNIRNEHTIRPVEFTGDLSQLKGRPRSDYAAAGFLPEENMDYYRKGGKPVGLLAIDPLDGHIVSALPMSVGSENGWHHMKIFPDKISSGINSKKYTYLYVDPVNGEFYPQRGADDLTPEIKQAVKKQLQKNLPESSPNKLLGEKKGDLSFLPEENKAPEDRPFGSWVGSFENGDDLVVGWRGRGSGMNAPTEGNGMYIARDKGLASQFSPDGKATKIKFSEPRKPLVAPPDEPLHVLHESDEITQPIAKTDSDWTRLNKQAYQDVTGGDEAKWDAEKVGNRLSDLAIKEGYDAIYVPHGHENTWTVLLKPKEQVAKGSPLFLPEEKGSLANIGEKTDELGFYSGLRKAAAERLPNRASPEQILATLDPAKGGVKKEELEVMGLPQFLEGKKSVTKQEVLDFLDANRVQLKEVVKGASDDTKIKELRDAIQEGIDGTNEDDLDSNEYPSYAKDARTMLDNGERALELLDEGDYEGAAELARENSSLENEYGDDPAWGRARRIGQGEGGRPWERETSQPTKFGQYQVPGGTNYKERMLVMPRNKLNTQGWTASESPKKPGPKTFSVKDATGRELGSFAGNTPEEAIGYAGAREAKSSDYTVPSAHQYGDEADINRVVHTRESDHVDTEGKSVRLLNELQSDWHQSGRKEGYKTPEMEKALQSAREEQDAFGKAMAEKYGGTWWGPGRMTESEIAEYRRINDLVSKSGPRDSAVPDAPFKKSWAELGFKNALAKAIVDGKEKIAWVRGETAADFFDLSKQVDGIYVKRHAADIADPERYQVSVALKKGQDGLGGHNSIPEMLTADKLIDYVGKEMAEKIVNNPDQKQTYEGDNLKVGGYGMRGFYDKILPDFVRKYVKPWGGTVKESVLPDPRSDSRVTPNHDEDGNPLGTKVWSVEITPAMKETVTRGQSMFLPEEKALSSQNDRRGNLSDLPSVERTWFVRGGQRIYHQRDQESGQFAPLESLKILSSHFTRREKRGDLSGVAFMPEADRSDAIKEVRDSIKAQQAEREKGFHVAPATVDNEVQPNEFYVSHPEIDRQWLISKDNRGWQVEDTNGSGFSKDFDSKEDAINAAKEDAREQLNQARGVHGDNLSNTYAIAPLFEHFDVPKYVSISEPWFRTKWGSWYATVNIDGTDYKVSVRDHEASRKDMGMPAYSSEVSKDWNPEEVSKAIGRIERWIKKKNGSLSGVR